MFGNPFSQYENIIHNLNPDKEVVDLQMLDETIEIKSNESCSVYKHLPPKEAAKKKYAFDTDNPKVNILPIFDSDFQ